VPKRRKRKKPTPSQAFKWIKHYYGTAEKSAEAFGISVATWRRWKQKGKPSKKYAKRFKEIATEAEFFKNFDWYVYILLIRPGKYRVVPSITSVSDFREALEEAAKELEPVEDVGLKFRITDKPGDPDWKLREMTMDDWREIIDAAKIVGPFAEFEAISAAERWLKLQADGFPLNLGDEMQLELL